MAGSLRKSARLAAAPITNLKDSDSEQDEELEVSIAEIQSETAPSGSKRKAERATAAPDEAPNAPVPPKRKRQKKAESDKAEARHLALFDIISKHATAIPTAAKDWVSKYKANKAECIAELMTLVIQAAGMDEVVTAEEVEGGELDDVVQQLAKQIVKEGASDPLHAKSLRNFRANYLAFWERLLQQAHAAGTAADDYLADRLINLLIAMTCSVVRPFRLVATLTAAQLVSSWVQVMVATVEARSTAEAQLLVEQKKKASKDMQARVKSLKATQERCSNEVTNLRSTTERVFEAIFTNRFRDVSAEIRAAVICAIGEWIRSDPANFLQDSYLKYLAWAMSDKEAEVRAAACRALLGLYAEERNKATLHEFTRRFSPRFQEIIYDIDQGVAVLGVQLVTRLVQLEEIDASAVKDVYMLLADDSAEVRQSVGELVVRLLEGYGASRVAQAQAGQKGRAQKPRREAVQLEGLLNIMAVLEASETGAAGPQPPRDAPSSSTQALHPSSASRPLLDSTIASLVDALYDRLDVLRDWKLLAGALVEEGPRAESRSSADVVNLAGVLAASAARTAAPPKSGKLGPRKASGAAAEGARQEMTGVLMRVLPDALQRHAAEPLVVAHLAACVPCMQLELYSLGQEGDALEGLLKNLSAAFFRHAPLHLLQRCSAAITHAVEKGPASLQDRALVVWQGCQHDAVRRLGAAVRAASALSDEELAAEVEELGSECASANSQLYSLHLALQRIHAVLVAPRGQELLSQPEALSQLDQLLAGAAHGRCCGPLLAPLATSCAFALLCWSITQASSGGSAADPGATAQLAARRDSFLHNACVNFDALHEDAARDRLFKMMADVMFLLGKGRWAGTALEGAAADPPHDVLQRCWQQCLRILRRYPEPPVDEDEGAQAAGDVGRGSAEWAEGAKVKGEAVGAMARLLLQRACGQQHQWLAVNLVTLLAGHGDAVTDVVKEVVAGCRKGQAAQLPEVFLGALQKIYSAYVAAAQAVGGEGEGEELEGREREGAHQLQLLGQLAKYISHQYIGASSSAAKAAVLLIVKRGLSYALQSPPANLLFMPWALGPLTVRLSPEDAAAVAEELEQSSEALQHGEGEEEEEAWSGLEMFLQGLQERAARGKVMKSALKAGRGQGPTPRRRISFAAGEGEAADRTGAGASSSRGHRRRGAPHADEGQEAEEEGEEEAEGEEEEDEEEQEAGGVREEPGQGGAGSEREQRASGLEQRVEAEEAATRQRPGRSVLRGVDIDAGPLGSPPSSVPDQGTSAGGAAMQPELAASENEDSAGSVQQEAENEAAGEEIAEREEAGQGGAVEEEGEEEMEMMPTEEELPGQGQHAGVDLRHDEAASSDEERGAEQASAGEELQEPPPRPRRRRRF